MTVGTFVLMLHSHLPYYRKAGVWPFGEENLYECMAETYIPLLNVISELYDEGIIAKLTVGITPILAEQLNDEHLRGGFVHYLDSKIKAASKDLERYPDDRIAHSKQLKHLAGYYIHWYSKIKNDFLGKYNKDLISAFKKLQDLGCIEITTSAATHGFSPLFATDSSLAAQFKIGSDTTKKLFGKKARGCWLPECAYRPGYEYIGQNGEKQWRPAVEVTLKNNDIGYFFTESHVIEGSEPLIKGNGNGKEKDKVNTLETGVYENIDYIPRPERASTGCSTYVAYWLPEAPVAIMGRNGRAGYQVWSAADGYPGDGCYREFHKKDENSGMNYWRVTSLSTNLDGKMLYDPSVAISKTEENADHYSDLIYQLLNNHKKETGEEGLVMVSFDTELFGHWWFEGVEFIKRTIKKLHTQKKAIERLTASEYLEKHPPTKTIAIPESSWGQGGHFWIWQNPQTEWMWPIIHTAEKRIQDIAEKHQDTSQNKVMHRALNQLARENLLLQSSDWPFLITTCQAHEYAAKRFREHAERFEKIADMIDSGNLDETTLQEIESIDNCFPEIDYRAYLPIPGEKNTQQAEKSHSLRQS